MTVVIGCVVEGHGEVEAVPELIRRIIRELEPGADLRIPHRIRMPRGTLLHRAGELERAVELLAAKVGPRGALLIVVDGEDECPAQLAPALLERARRARADLPIGVVLPKYEFEAWFLAAAESLRGCRGLAQDLEAPEEPESIRGAKEWLRRHTQHGAYSETIDQPALAAVFDLRQARQRSPSFDKCYREVERLFGSAGGGRG